MFKKIYQLLLVLSMLQSVTFSMLSMECSHIEQWDWSRIDIEDVSFPKNFIWGAANSSYQSEGTQTVDGKHIENTWTQWEKQHDLVKAGIGSDHWNRYQEDIEVLKRLGIKSYRFSIAHEKIEPVQGQYDEEALQHYEDLCKTLIDNGIEPVVTLFHHTWPVWFDELDAFEREENITHWLNFATTVADRLTKVGVKHWMPFNEPVGYCLEGYFRGNYPPGKKSLKLCGHVIRNILWAHVAFYKAAKEINPDSVVGMPKVFHPLHAYHWWNPVERTAAALFSHLTNDAVLEFFKTGEFKWGYKGFNLISDRHPDGKGALDVIGINYYYNTILKMDTGGIKTVPLPGRSLEENNSLYPEGLWDSIKKASTLNVPIWIAENGISTKDPKVWDTYMKQHVKVVSEAIKKGFDIQAYFVWAATDNFNWRNGFEDSYGLISIDFNDPQLPRTIRPGASDFISLIQTGSYGNIGVFD